MRTPRALESISVHTSSWIGSFSVIPLWSKTCCLDIPAPASALTVRIDKINGAFTHSIAFNRLFTITHVSARTMRHFHLVLLIAAASAKCHEPIIAHPLPEYDVSDTLLQHALADMNTAVISAASAPEFSATSFSIEITSSKATLWSKYHTAKERNASRPDIPKVNGDALYRIASITKTFTVLGLLYQERAGNLSLDDSVIKYIEELREPQNGTLPWKDITLRSLASQLSGIPRECAKPREPWPRGWMGCQTLEGMKIDFQ